MVFHVAVSSVQRHYDGNDSPQLFAAVFGSGPGAVLRNLTPSVYVFFALSGYLLGRPFVAAFVAREPLPATGRYLRNRALRILPAFWVVVTLVLLVLGTRGAGPGEIGAIYGFAQIYDTSNASELMIQAWTLHVELVFYALLPLWALALAWACRDRLAPRARVALVLALATLLFLAGTFVRARIDPGSEALFFGPASWLFAFAPGLALAALEGEAAPLLRRARLGGLVPWALLVAAPVLIVAAARLGLGLGRTAALQCAGAACLVAAVLTREWTTGRCWRAVDNRVLQWLGRRSYGMYLIHIAVLIGVEDQLSKAHPLRMFAITLPIVLAVSIAGAELSWRFVERPALDRRLPWRRARARDAPAPEAATA